MLEIFFGSRYSRKWLFSCSVRARDSGAREIFAYQSGIWEILPVESGIPLTIGIHWQKNQESGIWNLWRGIRNPGMSWIPLRGASFQYCYLWGAFDARFSKGFKPPKAFNNQAYIFIYFQILSVELEEAQGESPFTRISSSAFPQRTPPLLDLVLFVFQQRLGHEVEQVWLERPWCHPEQKFRQSKRQTKGPLRKGVEATVMEILRITVVSLEEFVFKTLILHWLKEGEREGHF